MKTFYRIFYTLSEIYLLYVFYELYGKDAAVMALLGMLIPIMYVLSCEQE